MYTSTPSHNPLDTKPCCPLDCVVCPQNRSNAPPDSPPSIFQIASLVSACLLVVFIYMAVVNKWWKK